MSGSPTPAAVRVLFVADVLDASAQSCLAAIQRAGLNVTHLSDVYAATAELALASDILAVLVDMRRLDPKEAGFLRLCKRFFPAVHQLVPDLNGTLERLASQGAQLETVPLTSLVPKLLELAAPVDGQTRAVESPAPHRSQTQPLSTDGGPESGSTGPSLHEAVRMKMAGGRSAPARRGPQGNPAGAASAPQSALSAEEVQALLARERGGPADDDADQEEGDRSR